jgi:hypothetical protein
MKKIEIKGKLSLNKKTIASLNTSQMYSIKGGIDGDEAPEEAKSFWKHCHKPSCDHDLTCTKISEIKGNCLTNAKHVCG